MKIAILTSGILPVPSVQGGAVENLTDFYLEYNHTHRLHDITVYSVYHPEAKRLASQRTGVNHYHFIKTDGLMARIKRRLYTHLHPRGMHNYFIEYFLEECYSHLRKQNYDCVILENRPGYAYKLSQRGIKNIVLHLHNDLLNSETPHHEEIFNSLRKVLTVSDYIKGRVSSISPNSKIQTIHNGIDLKSFSRKETIPINRKDLGFNDDDFVMIFSGRINKDKGIAELIDAILLLKDLPNIKLMIIGSTFFGNATTENNFVRNLKDKAKAIEKNLVFTGFVPYDQMPYYLQLADIAVIPSIWNDPFPTTVLEAQAMGLPIIASNSGGIPEEIGQGNAIIIPTGENFIPQLADAIRHLLQHPEERLKMSAASLQRATYYAKERFARDLFDALE